MNIGYYPTYTSTQIKVEKQRFYMSTSCAPLLTDLFLYSYEANFIQGLLKNEKKLVRSFNFTFRYIDAVLSLHNSACSDCVDRI